jgi:hypothetical protein
MRLTTAEYNALSILLDLLAETEDERVGAIRVTRPRQAPYCDGCDHYCGCPWQVHSRELAYCYHTETMVPSTRGKIGDGCPWYEGDEA